MTRTLAFANRKGGVAKTTSCLNVAFWLAGQGKRVLLVDTDPQGNLTEFFNYTTDDLEDRQRTIYFSYTKDTPLSSVMLRENPALVPASDLLSDVEAELATNSYINRATILRERIGEVRDRFDFVLIDCPPWLNILTINALVASNAVIIPMATDRFASNGVARLLGIVHDVRIRLNPGLDVLGVLPTKFNRTYTNDRRNLERVQAFAEAAEIRLFAPIPRSTVFNTEADEELSPELVAPNRDTVGLYAPLGTEILTYASS